VVFGIELDIEHVDIGEAFEQHRFAFHHGLPAKAPILPRPVRGAIADHPTSCPCGVGVGKGWVALDFETGTATPGEYAGSDPAACARLGGVTAACRRGLEWYSRASQVEFHKQRATKACPTSSHLFQLQQAKLFGAQGSFRQLSITPYIHHGEVVAYGFAFVAEALAANLRKASGSACRAQGKPDHRGIHFAEGESEGELRTAACGGEQSVATVR